MEEDLNRPCFTVIIPTYSRPTLLADAIGSVLRQSCPDWELIVVDDASPVTATAPEDPRIILLRNDSNIGKAASVNRAFAVSRGKYVTILDDDDLFREDRLENARKAHQMAPIACCLASAPSVQPARRVESPGAGIQLVPFDWESPIPSAGALSVERSHWVDLDPDFRACEDVDWVMRLQERCSQMALIESGDWVWGRHDGPRHLNGVVARVAGSMRLLEKHAAYYSREPRAHAQRLARLGHLHRYLGHRRQAMVFAIQSFLRRPNVDAVKLGMRVVIP